MSGDTLRIHPEFAMQCDPVLRPVLQAAADGQIRRRLEEMVRDAEPVIRSVIRRTLRVHLHPGGERGDRETQDALDVRGEILARLLAQVEQMRAGEMAEPVRSFRGWVAATAYRACNDHLRRRRPARAALRARVLYLLKKLQQSGQAAVWEDEDGVRLTGFAAWAGERRRVNPRRSAALLADPCGACRKALPHEDLERLDPGRLVGTLWLLADGPVPQEELVAILAVLWNVREVQVEGMQRGTQDDEEAWEPAAPHSAVEPRVEQTEDLRRLWGEIRQLPPRQAAALLLNLRDGDGRGVLALLPLLGIAGLEEIAAAMEMPPDRFAALWNGLPMDDLSIAAMLGCTRQQVINLRRVARDRLARRLAREDGL